MKLAHRVWLGALAMALALCGGPSAAGPVTSRHHAEPTVWEEHGAGRKDGLAVSAYPLPPDLDDRAPTVAEEKVEESARERWLRRHYQWLRALRSVVAEPVQPQNQGDAGVRAFVPPPPAGSLRLGDLIVLYADEQAQPAIPHLLDDGRGSEDVEPWRDEAGVFALEGGESYEDLADLDPEFIAPPLHRTPLAAAPPPSRLSAPSFQALAFGNRLPGLSQNERTAERQPRTAKEPPTVLGFFRQLAMDVASAPTTYVIGLLALLAWLVLRATVLTRD